MYRESIDSPDSFWSRETAGLSFRKSWDKLLDWQPPFAKWFVGAELNVSESCVDQHVNSGKQDKVALLWESEPGETVSWTYGLLQTRVIALAAALREAGISKGDRVAIYMGMVPEAVVAMLACARIGAPHTVIFGGFAADALKDASTIAKPRQCSPRTGLASRQGGTAEGNGGPGTHRRIIGRESFCLSGA
jgi:acetyl-CoA synthetase